MPVMILIQSVSLELY